MITEDYVSFEIAKLLKEKGFNAKCDKCYAYFADDDIRFLNLKYPKLAQLLIENRYPCITLQMAMKWLREVHNLHIWIDHNNKRGLPWYYEIHNIKTGMVSKIGDVDCGSYEVACEAAIKYCLENLI